MTQGTSPPRAEEGPGRADVGCYGGGKGRAPVQDMPQASRMPGSTQPGQWGRSSARHPCCGGQAAPHPRDSPQALLGLPRSRASTAGCPTPRPRSTGYPNTAGAGTVGDPIHTLAMQGGSRSPAQPRQRRRQGQTMPSTRPFITEGLLHSTDTRSPPHALPQPHRAPAPPQPHTPGGPAAQAGGGCCIERGWVGDGRSRAPRRTRPLGSGGRQRGAEPARPAPPPPRRAPATAPGAAQGPALPPPELRGQRAAGHSCTYCSKISTKHSSPIN